MTTLHESTASTPSRGERFGLPRHLKHIDPTVVGSILGILSAAIYTCSNVCLRSVAHCDAVWVACMKAVPTVVVAIVLVGVQSARGRSWNLSPWVLAALVGTGLIGQIGGNVFFQYGLQGIGLALAVPLTLGTIIIGGAVLGRFWLGEEVTSRMIAAMVLLLIAIPILSVGAEKERKVAEPAVAAEMSGVSVLMGIAAACTAGLAYAWQGVVLRRMATSRTPHSVTLLVLSATGVVTLGSISVAQLGVPSLLATAPADFANMVWAGLFNALGFFMLVKALELITLVHVNAINASQAAMASLAGIAVFHEPATLWLALGVGLTVVGLLLIDHGKQPVSIDEP